MELIVWLGFAGALVWVGMGWRVAEGVRDLVAPREED
jgi:hypothetical protein